MIKYNSKNERVKYNYQNYIGEALRKTKSTVNNKLKSIHRFEESTGFDDFKNFNSEQAIKFKKELAKNGDKPLSISTISSTLRNIKEFFAWLTNERGFKNIKVNDIEYFNLTENEERMAKSREYKPVPTLSQIKRVISLMPHKTDIEIRNRAIVAFLILTGVRIEALISLKIKHIFIEEGRVNQRPDEVKTKRRKQILSDFYPVGEEIEKIVCDWWHYLTDVKLYDFNAPFFPRTKMGQDESMNFIPIGLDKSHWKSGQPIREILNEAFKNAGLDYYNPHSFRNTLVLYGAKKCRNYEEIKAWSQSLGHEQLRTTFESYCHIDPHRQGEIMKELRERFND